MLRGEYSRELDFARLDPESKAGKAVSIDMLLRQGKQKEVLEMMASSSSRSGELTAFCWRIYNIAPLGNSRRWREKYRRRWILK